MFVAKRGSEIRVAVTGAGANGVFRVTAFEEALKKRFSPKSLEGLTIPADGMNSDIHGSAEYRAHLVGVLARRAVARGERDAGRGRRVRPQCPTRFRRHWLPGPLRASRLAHGTSGALGGLSAVTAVFDWICRP